MLHVTPISCKKWPQRVEKSVFYVFFFRNPSNDKPTRAVLEIFVGYRNTRIEFPLEERISSKIESTETRYRTEYDNFLAIELKLVDQE